MKYNRPTSFSQNNLFASCPRTWYMKYIQKIPGIEDLKYAHRGNVVHHILEKYYPDKKLTIPEMKDMFKAEWDGFKLDETSLKNKRDETWLMVLAGINLDLEVTSTELKIFYPDVVAYIDVLNTNKGIIDDWKTSTISEHNKAEYMKQVKFYSWLYYRKFKELPTQANVKYLKYTGTKSHLGCVPTMEDIKEAEEWHLATRKKMEYYLNNPGELPPFNQDYFFCPYKHLWDLEYQDPSNLMTFNIELYGNFFYIKGPVNNFLSTHFDNKYSYVLKNEKYIKKYRPNADTTIRFWHKTKRRLPIGFLQETMRSLHDYAEFRNKNPVITINDKRVLNEEFVKMPDLLLSGKTLRPYQVNAIETYVHRNKIGMLEMATGSGKSLIVTEVIRRLGVKTLFVVDKKELLYQAKKTFEDNLGIEIGVIGDGKKNIKDITVATIQTLTKMIDHKIKSRAYLNNIKSTAWTTYANKNYIYDYLDTPLFNMEDEDMSPTQIAECKKITDSTKRREKEFIKNYKLTQENMKDHNEYSNKAIRVHNMICDYLLTVRFVIFDEAHHAASNSYFGLGTYLKNTENRLGVTATAKRDDGNDMMMHATTGYICHKLQSQELIDKGYLMKPKIIFIKYDVSGEELETMKRQSFKGLINETPNYQRFYPNFIVNNKHRNNAITKIVKSHNGDSILILVKLVEHGNMLEKLIEDSVYIYGETPSKKRTQTLEDFKAGKLKILISTISIFAEGVDIPLLDVVINAAANKGDIKTIQVLGRVLRMCEGKNNAFYYDFADQGTFFFKASEARVEAFKKEGHTVKFKTLK